MAGVKLCTGRAICNHPHYENSWLRERTKHVYQIYSRHTPDTVYDHLIMSNVSHIVLEDSICLQPDQGDYCRTTDIVDLHNKHVSKLKNIFPLAGTLRDQSGENKDFFVRGLYASLNIPNSNICETRLYFGSTATNRMSGKNLWAEIFGPKVGKVG